MAGAVTAVQRQVTLVDAVQSPRTDGRLLDDSVPLHEVHVGILTDCVYGLRRNLSGETLDRVAVREPDRSAVRLHQASGQSRGILRPVLEHDDPVVGSDAGGLGGSRESFLGTGLGLGGEPVGLTADERDHGRWQQPTPATRRTHGLCAGGTRHVFLLHSGTGCSFEAADPIKPSRSSGSTSGRATFLVARIIPVHKQHYRNTVKSMQTI